MAELDAELLERVARWCAEAGRQTGSVEIRRALAPLGWDELLSVRALLADPPPARPLGPAALADIARGTPPDLAAEREREGRYRSDADADADLAAAAGEPSQPAAAAPKGAPRRTRPKRRDVVIRRARDVLPAPAPAAPARPLLDELFLPEGRGVLERLVRTHGGRRTTLTAALASGWRRADGAVPGDGDLSALLDHHGLARAFEHRERDELLHALRAAGGIKAEAATRLGIEPAALDAALARLGASPDAERIRERRRADLRARATLAERVRLLVGDEPRLRDLGLLGEFEEDLRARLPEHLRALRGASPIVPALARSLSLTPAEALRLGARLGVELVPRGDRAPPPERPRRDARPTRPTAKVPSRPKATAPARGRPPPRGGGADRPRTPRRGRRG